MPAEFTEAHLFDVLELSGTAVTIGGLYALANRLPNKINWVALTVFMDYFLEHKRP